MSKIMLEQWQALELFSRIVTKEDGQKEKFGIQDLYRTSFLEEKLDNYKSKDRAEKLSNKIFGKKPNSNSDMHPQAIYELARKIRQSEPIVTDVSSMNAYKSFINSDIESSQHYELPVFNKIADWHSNQVFDTFVNTKWWIYFKDRKSSISNKEDSFPEGITRALLIMHPFGKAEIIGYSVNNDEPEEYIGSYQMYGDDNFVQMNMRIKDKFTKDLHILVFTGKSKISFALGQFHNVGRSIYSGTLIIERVIGDLTDDERAFPGKFFDNNASEEVKGQVPSQAWLFFAERRRNIIRTPCKITNKADFDTWHRGKNPALY